MTALYLDDLWAAAEAKMASLGWDTDEHQERLRNPGTRRTPEKREMLARIAERAAAAGLQPLKANY